MPNPIKYSTSAQTLALKKGNYWIGTGDVGKGPTSTTDYWNGITPPSGGYTIYLNKASNGPSIYTAANDAALISLSNTIAGQTFETAAAALAWFATQTDKMVFDIDYEAIVTNGLVLNLDAGFTPSYPTTGTAWYDVSSSGNNGTLTNGPTYSSSGGGSIVLDGADDYINIPHNSSFNFGSGAFTISLVISSNQLEAFTSYIKKGGPQEWQNSPAGWYASSGNSGGDLSWYWVFADGAQHTEITPFSTFSKSNDTFPLNFFTITRNSSGAFARSWNGSYETISTVPIIGTSTWTASFDNNSDIWIGSGFSNYLNGNAAICRIYNRSLSQTEVLQNYNAQKGRFGL